MKKNYSFLKLHWFSLIKIYGVIKNVYVFRLFFIVFFIFGFNTTIYTQTISIVYVSQDSTTLSAINDNQLRLNENTKEGNTPQKQIPVGESFFGITHHQPSSLTLAAVSEKTLDIKNSERTLVNKNNANSILMKTNGIKKTNIIETDTRPKIRIGFDSTVGAHRQLLVGVDPNATNSFDIGYDAPMFDTNDNDIYWVISECQFVIQGVPDFNVDQIIPIGIVTKKAGEVTIKIDELENISSSTNIYLYDTQIDNYHDLRNSDYKTTLVTGESNKRFSLRFENKKAQSLSTDEKETNFGIVLFYSNNTLNINNNNIDTTINSVYLFSVLGQPIENWNVKENEQSNIQISLKNLNSGIYITKILTSNGLISKKIIIN